MNSVKEKIRTIPNFPKEGIMFRDITTLIQDGEAFKKTCNVFYERYKDQKIDKIAGIESRGFIFGSVLANLLGVGFVLIRKKGKLPSATISEKYSLEYGSAELEIHTDAINKGEKVILVDDLLATGGTLGAAVNLIERLGGNVVECSCIIELPTLEGRKNLKNKEVFSVFSFEGD